MKPRVTSFHVVRKALVRWPERALVLVAEDLLRRTLAGIGFSGKGLLWGRSEALGPFSEWTYALALAPLIAFVLFSRRELSFGPVVLRPVKTGLAQDIAPGAGPTRENSRSCVTSVSHMATARGPAASRGGSPPR